MLEPALRWLAELAQKAAAPIEIKSDDPRIANYLIDGIVQRFEKPVAPREHTVETLSDLVALATRFSEDEDYAPTTWYDGTEVTLVIDDNAHRAECASMALAKSDVFARLDEINVKKPKFDQKAFIRLLRIELAGTLDPVILLEKVRRLKFENGVRTESTIQRAQESLGRNIVSKVESDGEIPEEVTLQVPVFKSPGPADRHPLRCSVEVDPGDGTFRLLPLPDEIERVQQRAVDLVGEWLRANLPDSVPAYQGSP